MAAAGARIGEFNGKNLSTVGSSMVLIDDVTLPGVAEMQQWYAAGGAAQPAQALSRTGGGRADRRVTASIIHDEVRGRWVAPGLWTHLHAEHACAASARRVHTLCEELR